MLAVLWAAFSFPAQGQQFRCGNRTEAMAHLLKKYGEAPVAMGLSSNGNIIELMTTRNGETWTIVMTLPDGRTCLISAGQFWQRIIRPEGTAA